MFMASLPIYGPMGSPRRWQLAASKTLAIRFCVSCAAAARGTRRTPGASVPPLSPCRRRACASRVQAAGHRPAQGHF